MRGAKREVEGAREGARGRGRGILTWTLSSVGLLVNNLQISDQTKVEYFPFVKIFGILVSRAIFR